MEFSRKLAKITLLIISLLPYITFILGWAIVGLDKYTKDTFFIVLGGITFLSIPGLWIFYIVNVYRNRSVAKNQKTLWALLLFCGSFAVFPFYWYLHIWRDTEKIPSVKNLTQDVSSSFHKTAMSSASRLVKITMLTGIILPIVFVLSAIINRFNEPTNVSFYVLGVLAYVSLIGLIIIYIVNTFKNNRVAKNQRALWSVLLIAGNIIIFPIYWYLYIWREPKKQKEPEESQSTLSG